MRCSFLQALTHPFLCPRKKTAQEPHHRPPGVSVLGVDGLAIYPGRFSLFPSSRRGHPPLGTQRQCHASFSTQDTHSRSVPRDEQVPYRTVPQRDWIKKSRVLDRELQGYSTERTMERKDNMPEWIHPEELDLWPPLPECSASAGAGPASAANPNSAFLPDKAAAREDRNLGVSRQNTTLWYEMSEQTRLCCGRRHNFRAYIVERTAASPLTATPSLICFPAVAHDVNPLLDRDPSRFRYFGP